MEMYSEVTICYAGLGIPCGEDVARAMRELAETQEPRTKGLPRCAGKAFDSFRIAAENLPDDPTDKEAYAWIKEKCELEAALPPFKSWSRYLRIARRFFGEQKNSPRRGRNGRSIVMAHDA
jgi:hypothetical protein